MYYKRLPYSGIKKFLAIDSPAKRALLKRLDRVARLLDQSYSHYLMEQQKQLLREYEEYLYHEELLWFQKFRVKWLVFGDRNTRYFHGVTVVRRRRNKVEALQDNSSSWITKQGVLETMVTDFYRNHFAATESHEKLCIQGTFPALDETLMSSLGGDVTNEEIKRTIFQMGGFKAPGPDGYHVTFYQSQWLIVVESFCRLIKGFFFLPIHRELKS